MMGISVGLVALLVTLPPTPRVGEPSDLVTAANQREMKIGPARSTLHGRIVLPKAVADFMPTFVDAPRVRQGRKASVAGGIALIIAGTGMIIGNSIGVASGTTIPPGGERDGYLGKPGIVIGSGIVITGAVLLYRAHRHP